MAITTHASATEQTFDSDDFTFTFNLPSGGDNVMLVVCISHEKAETVTNVDWNNAVSPVAMTQSINTEGSDKAVSIWTLKPGVFGNLEIRVRTASSKKFGIIVIGFAGVDATGATDVDDGTNTPDIALTSTVSGSLCIDCLSAEENTVSVDSGQTELHQGANGMQYGASTEPSTGGTVDMGWTMESGKKFAYAGVELTEAAGGFPHSQGYIIG